MTGVEELRAKLARLDAACDAWDVMVETCHRPDGDQWQAAQRRLHEAISAAAWERMLGTPDRIIL